MGIWFRLACALPLVWSLMACAALPTGVVVHQTTFPLSLHPFEQPTPALSPATPASDSVFPFLFTNPRLF